MQKWTFIVLIWLALLTPRTLHGQTPVSNGSFTLPTGQVKLKTLFETISKQTGIIFSYDANNVIDYESVLIGTNNRFTMTSFLTSILPPDIKYKRIGKYIVLNKKSDPKKIDAKPLSTNKNIDLSDFKPLASEVVYLFPKIDFNDSIKVNRMGSSTDTVGRESLPCRMQWGLETTYNPHLMHLSLRMGKKHLFGKATLGYDYNGSYHLGLGVGANHQFTPALGLSLELDQYALAFGSTRKMNVNTYTTELTPLVTYSLKKRLHFKVGPSIYRIQSNTKTKQKTIDLGHYWGFSPTIGLQIDLFEPN